MIGPFGAITRFFGPAATDVPGVAGAGFPSTRIPPMLIFGGWNSQRNVRLRSQFLIVSEPLHAPPTCDTTCAPAAAAPPAMRASVAASLILAFASARPA